MRRPHSSSLNWGRCQIKSELIQLSSRPLRWIAGAPAGVLTQGRPPCCIWGESVSHPQWDHHSALFAHQSSTYCPSICAMLQIKYCSIRYYFQSSLAQNFVTISCDLIWPLVDVMHAAARRNPTVYPIVISGFPSNKTQIESEQDYIWESPLRSSRSGLSLDVIEAWRCPPK